eukprot:CAMPEP_0201492292 /NCGR_PEP_ID=MMETSP0151_2-20130828/32569_1 /ASSEMBLY_ACC=CAM_ASM_000257 /TAXON_ID=200890 /ORGANISM="Paramoeba atlantica, Strain 621/1 / CCAP 1560/9" /LENGTH=407 /DNA_ID=CAMNT_0047879027 /DNA_START=52 /DNA_END=1275 /DNA_ORIENTATION=+
MPESTFMCIDTSEYSRNSDHDNSSRLDGVIDAANLLSGAKLHSNPENTIGFLTMGGEHCEVRESLTNDVDRMLASLSRVSTSGLLHLVEGLRIGCLALAHRGGTRRSKRLVVFVCSPVSIQEDLVMRLGKKLRKEEIALDLVNIGNENNISLLSNLVQHVSKENNSHFLHVPAPENISGSFTNSEVFPLSGGASMQIDESIGGVDPNVDPELAMVLRMSAEEERKRQDNLLQCKSEKGEPSKETNYVAEQESNLSYSRVDSSSPPFVPTTEDEDLELALQLSRELEALRSSSENNESGNSKQAESSEKDFMEVDTANNDESNVLHGALSTPDNVERTKTTSNLECLSLKHEMKEVEKNDSKKQSPFEADKLFDEIVSEEGFLSAAAQAAGINLSTDSKAENTENPSQ